MCVILLYCSTGRRNPGDGSEFVYRDTNANRAATVGFSNPYFQEQLPGGRDPIGAQLADEAMAESTIAVGLSLHQETGTPDQSCQVPTDPRKKVNSSVTLQIRVPVQQETGGVPYDQSRMVPTDPRCKLDKN